MGAVAVIGISVRACRAPKRAPSEPPPSIVRAVHELHVPHLDGAIVLDGDTDDEGWAGNVARTGAFADDSGGDARPHSSARLVWGDGHLYLALYAADEDIRATYTEPDSPLWLEDAFHMIFRSGTRERTIDVSPLGVVTDGQRENAGAFDYAWQSGAHVSREIDGTMNQPGDDDEEWAIEMAIPFETLGLSGRAGERIAFSIGRCDQPRRGARVCATWGRANAGVLVLDGLSAR
jgi:hypothetical protein